MPASIHPSTLPAPREVSEGDTHCGLEAQIWSAVCVHVLVAIVKKHLGLKASLDEIPQIPSLALFEKTELFRLFQDIRSEEPSQWASNQLNLFN
jgi:hypothetical protein